MSTIVAKLLACLPQTQCQQCGYSGCLPYATALTEMTASSNQCPPGGVEGHQRLNKILGELDLAGAIASAPPPAGPAAGSLRATIDALACIGCTRCIDVCPVDAIVGAPKRLHAVIEAECTGCDLCPAVCPVDCIALVPASAGSLWDDDARLRARQRQEHVSTRNHQAKKEGKPPRQAATPMKPDLDAILAKARERLARQRPEAL